jgi:hypothetical protein
VAELAPGIQLTIVDRLAALPVGRSRTLWASFQAPNISATRKGGVDFAIPARWKPAVHQQVSTDEEADRRGTLKGRAILTVVVLVVLILVSIRILVRVVVLVTVAILVSVVVLVPVVVVFESATISVPVARKKLLPIMVRFDPSSTFIGRPSPVALVPLIVMADRIPIPADPHELGAWA